jgi:hypothetical protein
VRHVSSDRAGGGHGPRGRRAVPGPGQPRSAGAATARSQDPATAQAPSALTSDLRVVLGEIRAGSVVPGNAMAALNRDAAHADATCGTLHA